MMLPDIRLLLFFLAAAALLRAAERWLDRKKR